MRLAVPSLGTGRGFTLIELMIAMVVVALLAAVAYPAYTSHVRRGKIAAALGELSAVRVRLEQFYQDNRHYGSSGGGCGVAMPSAPGFRFACSGANPQSFVVTATGEASQGMGGYAYSVDQADQQKTLSFAGVAVDANCWLKKEGERC